MSKQEIEYLMVIARLKGRVMRLEEALLQEARASRLHPVDAERALLDHVERMDRIAHALDEGTEEITPQPLASAV